MLLGLEERKQLYAALVPIGRGPLLLNPNGTERKGVTTPKHVVGTREIRDR